MHTAVLLRPAVQHLQCTETQHAKAERAGMEHTKNCRLSQISKNSIPGLLVALQQAWSTHWWSALGFTIWGFRFCKEGLWLPLGSHLEIKLPVVKALVQTLKLQIRVHASS